MNVFSILDVRLLLFSFIYTFHVLTVPVYLLSSISVEVGKEAHLSSACIAPTT